MNARQMFPVGSADFDAVCGRMLQVVEVDVQFFESGVNLLLSNHSANEDLGLNKRIIANFERRQPRRPCLI